LSVYFGTDGIRGIVNNFLTPNLAFRCGNALAKKALINFDKSKYTKPLIVVGGDTRTSRNLIILSFCSGVLSGGVDVVDVGICPTPGVAFITKNIQASFGIVISASHNSAEYNGIKVFNGNGIKILDKEEELLEKDFEDIKLVNHKNIGIYKQNFKLTKIYKNHLLLSCSKKLSGLNVVLDCSNGASYKIAPDVFKSLGAKVYKHYCKNDGLNINNNCGALHTQNLQKLVKKHKADIGFAFDGDADRIITCDEKGNILDGDKILFVLATYLKSKNLLLNNTIVGTTHTNMGLEKQLKKQNITLLRTSVGDKYIINKLNQLNLNLGGESSGHIILKDFALTGDGVLTSIKIAEILLDAKKPLSQICCLKLYPQKNVDCIVQNKQKIIDSSVVKNCVSKNQNLLGNTGRIIVRSSGTEPKIRIMVEGIDQQKIEEIALNIKEVITKVDID